MGLISNSGKFNNAIKLYVKFRSQETIGPLRKNPTATAGETATVRLGNFLLFLVLYLSERLVNPRPFLVMCGLVR